MSKIQDAIALAKKWAADSSHGYDQSSRWGPDYDCSSFLIEVWEQCGVKVKTAGATYTGNMRAVFTRCGFEIADVSRMDLTIGALLEPGDILLNEIHHVAMYIGGGQLVQASMNELGTVTGGKSGDQTGREIAVRSYYDYPWDCVLRYVGVSEAQEAKRGTYVVKSGDSWWGIAQSELGNGWRMYELAELNGKTTGSVIHPGDILRLRESDSVDPNAAKKIELEQEVAKFGGKIIWQ